MKQFRHFWSCLGISFSTFLLSGTYWSCSAQQSWSQMKKIQQEKNGERGRAWKRGDKKWVAGKHFHRNKTSSMARRFVLLCYIQIHTLVLLTQIFLKSRLHVRCSARDRSMLSSGCSNQRLELKNCCQNCMMPQNPQSRGDITLIRTSLEEFETSCGSMSSLLASIGQNPVSICSFVQQKSSLRQQKTWGQGGGTTASRAVLGLQYPLGPASENPPMQQSSLPMFLSKRKTRSI